MDSVTATELSTSYMKRKQFEAHLLALEVGKMLGGVSEEVGKATRHVNNNPLGRGRTSADALFGSLGFRPELGINKVKH